MRRTKKQAMVLATDNLDAEFLLIADGMIRFGSGADLLEAIEDAESIDVLDWIDNDGHDFR